MTPCKAVVLFGAWVLLVAVNAVTAHSATSVEQRTDAYREKVWHMQRVMGEHLTPTVYSDRRSTSIAYKLWVMRLWHRRAVETSKRFENVPYEEAWECIHGYEGSWSDPGAPYYGGLQMDMTFQSTYGPYLLETKGTADNWTPLEQMWVAAKAMRSGRGFYPWPNTARYCGLI